MCFGSTLSHHLSSFLQNLFMEHNAKTSAKLSSVVTNKMNKNGWIWNFHTFSILLCTFWTNTMLFEGLEN